MHRFVRHPPAVVLSLGALIGLVVAGLLPAAAQDAPKGDKGPAPEKKAADDPAPPEIPFGETNHGLRVLAGLQMLAAPHPTVALAIRTAASEQALLWPEWQLVLNEPPPLKQEWLDKIRDGTAMPSLGKVPLNEVPADDRAFYLAYCEALVYASTTPPELFQKSAEELHYVTYAHLLQEPWKYRGKVIPVNGRLLRLRRWDAPRRAQEQGVRFFYEGWVKGPTKKANPFCVVFTTLPEGLKESEEMDREVSFSGYYLKRFSYLTDKDKKETQTSTHLLIGPTVTLKPLVPEARPDSLVTPGVLYSMLAFIAGVVLLVFGLTWWVHRSDRQIRERLAALRARPEIELGDAEQQIPTANPVDPGAPPDPGDPGPAERPPRLG